MPISITDDIFWVGVNDQETALFEALWPLPHGVSYNSYLIRDEKTALIDAVKKDYAEELVKKIQPLLGDHGKLDYLVINHIEPDHSGAIEFLTKRFPDMCIVGNEKTIGLLNGFYKIPNKNLVIKEKDTLSLGKHTLEFLMAPMVHWPETMLTYERKSQTLFSGDLFGGFGALQGGIFDDEVDLDFFIEETRRYFTNVIGKYSSMVLKALEKISRLSVKTVASTHGPVYRKDPKRIIDLYARWSRHETEKGAVIVYASMYGHTKKIAEAIAEGLAANGVKEVRTFNISHTHISFIINEIWRLRGLVLCSCTYNTKLFPLMELLLSVLENDRILNHVFGLAGSYSWSGGALAALKSSAEKGAWKVLDPIIDVKCAPTAEVIAQCRELAKNLSKILLNS